MTNDDLSRIERTTANGRDLGNHDAKLLLEQLRQNARERIAFEVNMKAAEHRGAEAGARAERAKIVAWLMERAMVKRATLAIEAGKIEAGEHDK